MVFEFELRKHFEVKLGQFTSTNRTCDVSAAMPNRLLCTDHEPTRNWTTQTSLDFSPEGIKMVLHFDNKNITTEKYFERVQSDSSIVVVNESS